MNFYQVFFKKDFINTLSSESEVNAAKGAFAKSKKLEEAFGKDLYDFDSGEIEMALYNINTPNVSTINVYVNIMRKYTDYAISQGRKISNINLFRTFKYAQFEKYTAKHKLKYYSREDLLELLKVIYNPQDYAVCLGLFEGFSGHNYSEFTNLTIQDLKEAKETKDGYEIKLTEKDSEGNKIERMNVISNETYRALESTYRVEEYYSKNGNSDSIAKKRDVIEGNHIFRNARINSSTEERVDKQFIYRKLNVVAEATEKMITSTTTIINSGIIYYLARYSVDNKADIETMRKVANKFGIAIKQKAGTNKLVALLNKHREALFEHYGVEVEI